jgi:hypothetical protein
MRSYKYEPLGLSLKQAGVEFYYHPQCYEFRPSPEGTLLDFLVVRTDPAAVNFQGAVFWIAWPEQGPVRLLRHYPTGFPLRSCEVRTATDCGKGTSLFRPRGCPNPPTASLTWLQGSVYLPSTPKSPAPRSCE